MRPGLHLSLELLLEDAPEGLNAVEAAGVRRRKQRLEMLLNQRHRLFGVVGDVVVQQQVRLGNFGLHRLNQLVQELSKLHLVRRLANRKHRVPQAHAYAPIDSQASQAGHIQSLADRPVVV